jgi:cell division protein FtsZ
MSINLHLPDNVVLKPCITVFGVGGAGCNAVNNMIAANLGGTKFVVANTDAQSLEYSKADKKIQLGETTTRGLGAGASPDVGRISAEESLEEIGESLEGSNMVFITAGMGGGTGTGAAPVVAQEAKRRGILTVGVVTKPFHFEGAHRMRLADSGVHELEQYVDTLIVIPNQNLFRVANEKTTFSDAFKMADNVLHAGVRGVTDLITQPGLINLDFADIRTVMSEMGKAMMGTGEATGENRALVAAEAAISNPLLDHSSMKGARGVLINITGGADLTLFEVDEAANRIREEVDPDANIIFGSAFSDDLDNKIRVSVVATGINQEGAVKMRANRAVSQENKVETSTISESFFGLNNAVDQRTEFEKRNIPSYQNNPSNAPVDGIIDDTVVEKDLEDIFLSPAPQDPESHEAIDFMTSYQNEIIEEEKKPSFFQRMVNSVGFGKANKQESELIERGVDVIVQERVVLERDSLDIPAYQRRKK